MEINVQLFLEYFDGRVILVKREATQYNTQQIGGEIRHLDSEMSKRCRSGIFHCFLVLQSSSSF